MEKMRMESSNITEKNIGNIGELFPNVITEIKDENGKLKKTINFTLLKQMLSENVIDGDEAYEFTWVGKKDAIIETGKPVRKALRPCKEDSKDWEATENIYIEGDNFDSLKLLQESYLSAVKVIYIDPPYNTGNDFVYRDKFAISNVEYADQIGQYDLDENKLFQNTESNGRFHSDWCSMMYSRLMLARNLLSDDGTIFISIDDNEVKNIRNICDELFGESNFLATIVWQKKYSATNDSKGFSTTHDYIVVYQKSPLFSRNLLPRTDEQNKPYKNDDGDGKGLWRSDNLLVKSFSQSGVYPVQNPNTGKMYYPPEGSCWRASAETMKVWLSENRIYFGKDGIGAPQLKRYLNEVQQGRVPITWWGFEDVGHNDAANKEIRALFGTKAPFDTPKPTTLIDQILRIASDKNSIVLDFFSGSATTAHSVLKLNLEDGGKRKFIMIQLQEECKADSVGEKAGYKNICEIGKERIRRAGEKIKAEAGFQAQNLDVGFRVLKLDSSNMKDVYYSAGEYSQGMLSELESNIKEDRTDLDLLFGCLLEWGLPLSLSHKNEKIDDILVHTINDGDLMACFAQNISSKVVKEIAKRQPLRVVFRDSSFTNSPEKINVEEIFKLMSPKTSVKVL